MVYKLTILTIASSSVLDSVTGSLSEEKKCASFMVETQSSKLYDKLKEMQMKDGTERKKKCDENVDLSEHSHASYRRC